MTFKTVDADAAMFEDLKNHKKAYEGVWLNGLALEFNDDEEKECFETVNQWDFNLAADQKLPTEVMFGVDGAEGPGLGGALSDGAARLVAFYYHYKKDDRVAQTLVTFIWNPDNAPVAQRMLSAQCYGDFSSLFENSKKLDSVDEYETLQDKLKDVLGRDHEEVIMHKNTKKQKGKARDGSEIA